jgi:hypothetical protein
LAAGVVFLTSLVLRRQIAGLGVAFAAAAFVALAASDNVLPGRSIPAALPVGMVLAYGLTEVAHRVRPQSWLTLVASVPGAIVTAGALVGVATWIRVVVAGFCVVGSAGVADFDSGDVRRGAAPLMWLITVGAVYATVPDTEAARAVIGVAIPIACLGWPGRYARFGTGGAAASACALGWVIGQDGFGRAGAVVGAAATLGLFVLEPLVRRAVARPRTMGPTDMVDRAATVALHLVIAMVAARWAGQAHDATVAALRLLGALPIALLLTLALVRRDADDPARTPPRPPRERAAHPRTPQ